MKTQYRKTIEAQVAAAKNMPNEFPGFEFLDLMQRHKIISPDDRKVVHRGSFKIPTMKQGKLAGQQVRRVNQRMVDAYERGVVSFVQ